MRIITFLLFAPLVTAGPVAEFIKQSVDSLKRRKAANEAAAVSADVIIGEGGWIVAISQESAPALLVAPLRASVAKLLPAGQMGASGAAGGSTNAVQQPRVGGLVGVAIETEPFNRR